MAKKSNKKKNDILAYFGSFLEAAQGSPSAIQELSNPQQVPDLVSKPLNVNTLPLPSQTQGFYSEGAPDLQGKALGVNTLPLPSQTNPGDPSKALTPEYIKQHENDVPNAVRASAKEQKKGLGTTNMPALNIKSLVGSALPFINAITGERDPARTRPFSPLEVYNPHPLGTGSQAIYKDGGELKPSKAKEMLKDGTANDKKLTKKQKQYFGMVAAGKAQYGMELFGGEGPIPPTEYATTLTNHNQNMYDKVNGILAQGGNPMTNADGMSLLQSEKTGNFKKTRALMDNLTIYNQRPDVMNMTPEERINNYYQVASDNKDVASFKTDYKNFGSGPVSSYGTNKSKAVTQLLAKKENGGKLPKGKKAFWGAIAGVAGQAGSKITDQMKEQTKMAAQAPQEVLNFVAQMANFKDTFHPSEGYKPGPYLQPEQILYENGGELNGVQLRDEGNTEMLSYNPYDGGTMQLNGPSHRDGGIDMSYGGNRIEAEGGETIVKDAQGNAHIGGNMRVAGTGVKFKTMFKKMAEKEKEYERIKTKGTSLVETSDPSNKFERLKFNSGRAMMEGGDMGQKDIAKKKNELTSLQSAILATAEEHGIDPEKLSQGKINKVRGKGKAASGAVLGGDPTLEQIIAAIAQAESGGDYTVPAKGGSSAFGKYQMIKGLRKDIYSKYFSDKYKSFDEFDSSFKTTPALQEQAMRFRAQELNTKYKGDLKQIVLAHRLGEGGAAKMMKNPKLLDNAISTSIEGSTDKETPNEYLKKVLKPTKPNTVPNRATAIPKGVPVTPIDPFTLPNVPLTYQPPVAGTPPDVNAPELPGINPPVDRAIPSNVRGLSPIQILPELNAIGGNRVEPVNANQFVPLLEQPYQVSFQDRLNKNQSTFNALVRQMGNNPLALSSLSAQQYEADNAVKADEFRVNQAESAGVYNRNRNTLNQAEEMNLGIRDKQYVRQAQAKSNTKAQTNSILNSITGKYLQNRQENQKLALYENLYNFRAGDTNKDGINDKMINYNPDQQFDFQGMGDEAQGTDARTVQTLDKNGEVKSTRVTTPSAREQRLLDIKLLQMERKQPLVTMPRLFNK